MLLLKMLLFVCHVKRPFVLVISFLCDDGCDANKSVMSISIYLWTKKKKQQNRTICIMEQHYIYNKHTQTPNRKNDQRANWTKAWWKPAEKWVQTWKTLKSIWMGPKMMILKHKMCVCKRESKSAHKFSQMCAISIYPPFGNPSTTYNTPIWSEIFSIIFSLVYLFFFLVCLPQSDGRYTKVNEIKVIQRLNNSSEWTISINVI